MTDERDRPAIAIVIGRAGSKGLPGKNALPLLGRSLVCWTIDHALAAKSVGRVIVSTDSKEIAATARAQGVEVIDRPAALATDTASVQATVRHALSACVATEPIVVVLYANVPVRPADLIDRAVETLLATKADSVQSYSTVGRHHPAWMVRLDEDGRIALHEQSSIDRRQDLPPVFLPDGGVIAVKRSVALAARDEDGPHAFFGRDRRGIVSEPSAVVAVVDVDGAHDLLVAEAMLRRAPGELTIGSRTIGWDQPPYVVAEIGVNHDGSAERALDLVEAAFDAGAAAVKLQLFCARRLLSAEARLAGYQRRAGERDALAMLERLELDPCAVSAVVERAHARGGHAIATLFSVAGAREVAPVAFDAFKIASPDVVNRPLIEALLRETGRPLLISTGAATIGEISLSRAWLGDHPHLFLQCVSSYPAPEEHAALGGLAALADSFAQALGYSDHTTAVDTGALAVAAGASLLEKHLTLDRTSAGPDHAASLEPCDFAEYVRLAERAWRMRGPRAKQVLAIEEEVRSTSRQSLTTARALPAGHVLAAEDLTIKRPGSGLPPAAWHTTIGRRLRTAVEADVPLRSESLL